MKSTPPALALLFALCAASVPLVQSAPAPVRGWLGWRGNAQDGISRETNLPAKVTVDGGNQLWTADFPGQSTAVVANGKLYIMGYLGDGPDLQEGVACFDAETGKKLWQQLFTDFLSDTIYLRYATSSPTIDPETGNVYVQCTQGIFACFTADGKPLWQHSLMESYGRLTFPNARTASPVIDQDLVITRGITANWGANGPAADRFYAFDKKTGALVWSSSPGDRPKDNSFSLPILGWLDGKRVLYSAAGDGSVVCVNARTGEPLWRVPLFKAGINATVGLSNNDTLVAIFGTPYEKGEMVALKLPKTTPPPAADGGPAVLDPNAVRIWRNELSTSTSSPIVVGNRVYVVTETGELCSVDVANGKILWRLKVGIEQRNSSPLFADGRLYLPVLNALGTPKEDSAEGAGGKGAFYIIEPTDTEGKILSQVTLDGRCFGNTTPYNGKIYVQTTQKLYCFGTKGNNPGLKPDPAPAAWPAPGVATQLQIIPSEVQLPPAGVASFHARALDAKGFVVTDPVAADKLKWASYIPATARVKANMKGAFNAAGKLVADPAPIASAGAYEASLGEMKGYIRGRVMPDVPLSENFESFDISTAHETEVEADGKPSKFAYPPLPWIGARFKFEVRERDGNKVLTKTIDNKFFQRATVFIGHPEMKNYTVEADVLSDGNRRKMSDVGVINQRYCILLKGNEQMLEVNSNLERLRHTVPFKWAANEWYHLKTRVDIGADGVGTIRAKAWKKGEAEPAAWTLEMKHTTAHQTGSPGLFGFSPQDMRVYIDNVSVTKNEK
ncbi:outer membrane protein assembly factor BamB family protein [Horticoccus sp. 23ND18S-11]|uniref:outer membrane protein assembly factor BamB family protein n=1 Tax=Horticoccus sp. 23ND18S-11 TaxID=3391832 RepID=UPI0039C9BB9A